MQQWQDFAPGIERLEGQVYGGLQVREVASGDDRDIDVAVTSFRHAF